MKISVVIPTYNRAGLLRKTIPAWVNQCTGDFTYEVIFVSNGSTDNSGELLNDAAARNPGKVRYFRIEPTGGPSAPRNFGIRQATGDVIVISDDDVLPDTDLVLQYAEFHKKYPEQQHAAVGEAYVPPEFDDDPMSFFHTFPYDEVRNLDRLSYLHFWTCNVSVKREFMLRAGMFDESFLYYEDMICGHRLMTHGMHLHFLPGARGQHLHQLKPSGVAAKGVFTGKWLHPFVEKLPHVEIKRRFGILSPDIGGTLLLKRLSRRLCFRIADNPLTLACLRALGAEGAKRTRFSDAYYFLIFRRNLLAGYYQARRESRLRQSQAPHPVSADWVNRGE